MLGEKIQLVTEKTKLVMKKPNLLKNIRIVKEKTELLVRKDTDRKTLKRRCFVA